MRRMLPSLRRLCARCSRTCDWKYVTGFNLPVVENIIARGLEYYKTGTVSKISPNCALFLTLAWVRFGASFETIKHVTGWNAQMVQRAIVRGMKAFSRCFEPFVSYGPVKKLSEVADEDDKAVLTSTELESQFIVDGKHVPATRTGPESERTTYYSYKLRHVGYQFQCVITHSGHCVHVSRGERAGTRDMAVYMNRRE